MLLGVAVAIGFVTIFNPLSIFGLLAFVGAAVYLADVRPALRQVRGIGGTRGQLVTVGSNWRPSTAAMRHTGHSRAKGERMTDQPDR